MWSFCIALTIATMIRNNTQFHLVGESVPSVAQELPALPATVKNRNLWELLIILLMLRRVMLGPFVRYGK
jgi:hypothetical protein